MKEAFLSIGSNIGDRFYYLKEAIRALHAHEEIRVTEVSSIFETAPVGLTDQADFLNIVCRLETKLSALELLSACQDIEQVLGRVRNIRWGPRTVDLDILLYDNDNVEMDCLTIPHPRMQERGFVLVPLLEIAPSVEHPVSERPYSEEKAVHDKGVLFWKTVELNKFLKEL